MLVLAPMATLLDLQPRQHDIYGILAGVSRKLGRFATLERRTAISGCRHSSRVYSGHIGGFSEKSQHLIRSKCVLFFKILLFKRR